MKTIIWWTMPISFSYFQKSELVSNCDQVFVTSPNVTLLKFYMFRIIDTTMYLSIKWNVICYEMPIQYPAERVGFVSNKWFCYVSNRHHNIMVSRSSRGHSTWPSLYWEVWASLTAEYRPWRVLTSKLNFKTVFVLPSLMFPFHLLLSSVHPTWFSFRFFPGFLVIFMLLQYAPVTTSTAKSSPQKDAFQLVISILENHAVSRYFDKDIKTYPVQNTSVNVSIEQGCNDFLFCTLSIMAIYSWFFLGLSFDEVVTMC